MLCDFHPTDEPGVYVCSREKCGRIVERVTVLPIHAHCLAGEPPLEPPLEEPELVAPGAELHAMLSSLGISPKFECGCENKLAQMNTWGVNGCREHFEEIVGWLRENAGKYSWSEKLRAGAMAAASGLAFKISWADPFPDLVRLAIERAEAKSPDSSGSRGS